MVVTFRTRGVMIAIVFLFLFGTETVIAAPAGSPVTGERSFHTLGQGDETSSTAATTLPSPFSLSDGDADFAGSARGGVLFGVGDFAVRFSERLFDELRGQLEYPFRCAKRSPTRFLVGVAGITALVLTDPTTYEVLAPRETLEENGFVKPAATLSNWGRGTSAMPLVIGIGAFGLVSGSRRERETSIMLVEALLTTEAWTQLIKAVSGRERPRQAENDVADWAGPSNLFGNDRVGSEALQSFPSGHTAGIWSLATILAYQYPAHGVVPILAYGTATAMAYSRMVVGAHWLSDVVVGGLIGYGCARQVLSTHRSGQVQAAERSFRFGFEATPGYKEFNVRHDF